MSIKQAVIVAAGQSTRLHPLTLSEPKGLLLVAGEPILARSIRLLRHAGIEDITVVVGCQATKVQQVLGDSLRYAFNPFYLQSNNMASLWIAQHKICGGVPFLYLHGDLVFERPILEIATLDREVNGLDLIVDYGPTDDEAMKVEVDSDGLFVRSSKTVVHSVGEWVGVARIGADTDPFLFSTMRDILMAGDLNAYDTAAFNLLAQAGHPINLLPTDGARWADVDTLHDLTTARRTFTNEG